MFPRALVESQPSTDYPGPGRSCWYPRLAPLGLDHPGVRAKAREPLVATISRAVGGLCFSGQDRTPADSPLNPIIPELVKTVRANVTIDWTMKETVRARLRVMVKRGLRKFGYPPDK